MNYFINRQRLENLNNSEIQSVAFSFVSNNYLSNVFVLKN